MRDGIGEFIDLIAKLIARIGIDDGDRSRDGEAGGVTDGARRARRCGLLFANFQAKMNATAFNLKRWMRLLELRDQTAKMPVCA